MTTVGESPTHLFIALRTAIIVLDGRGGAGDDTGVGRAILARTGVVALPLDARGRMEVLHAVGAALGAPGFFVTLTKEGDGDTASRPASLKSGSASRAAHFADRLRVLLERLAQRVAVTAIQNGTVLIDGALTLRSRDTPDAYLRDLARRAGKAGNSIVALSKRSDLLVRGRPVRFWLDDAPDTACCLDLTAELRRDAQGDARAERSLGNICAARLSPRGPTFRLDLKAAPGVSDAEALQQFWTDTPMRLGYPEPLARAHALCSFSSADLAALTADARARYRLPDLAPVEPNLTPIFGPFAGRYK